MDDLKVREEFERRAAAHGDANAVLDATLRQGVSRQNLWRDYSSKRLARRHLRPRAQDVLLDYGCGVGRLSLYFAPEVARVVGVDTSPAMIGVAEAERVRRGYDNVTFLTTDGVTVPLPAGSMHKALAFWTLQHVSDTILPAVLSGLRQALLPAGWLLCFEQVRDQPREAGDIHLQRSPEAYRRFFERAGFGVVEQRLVARYPSYAMAVWNRFLWLPTAAFPLLDLVERFTVNRRPQWADYYTCLFALRRRD